MAHTSKITLLIALHIMNLDPNLKTGRKINDKILCIEIGCFDELQSYDNLDKYVVLDRVFRYILEADFRHLKLEF